MLKAHEIEKLRSLLSREDERLPSIFGALGDPRRCTIFRSFLKRDRLCVSDVAKTLKISMSLASQHLKELENVGLVVRQREGRRVYFQPNATDELVRAIIKAVQ
jgi:DNA-binding transcriptional ArsR family regulator